MHAQLPIATDTEGDAMRHEPVLVEEVLDRIRPQAGSLLIDCTVGHAGHAVRLLEASSPGGRVVGIDRDADALAVAREHLARFGDRFTPVHADFRSIRGIHEDRGLGPVDGILADLGVSSAQLLDPARGFSFTEDGPLDMRMDRSRGTTAAELLEAIDEPSLARLLRRNGEEPAARTVARAILRARRERPIRTTGRLAAIIGRALGPASRRRIHPATRTFMALRIAVNDELSGIGEFIEDAVRLLRPGGRIVVISFHSLEDRLVKKAFRSLEGRCTCPPGLPVCGCGRVELARVLTPRPVKPTGEETDRNPRSRSAKLRAAERV